MTGILETNPYNVDGTILHIGAGQCNELENYLETSACSIVLVEPNPDDARILKQRARQHKRVKVMSAAVSDSDGKATLYLCNDKRFNSLLAPEMFRHQLPGLQALATPKVETLTIASLLETLSLAKEKTHCLVIEARGAEETILRSLKEASGHPLFEHIMIYAGSSGAEGQTNITSSSLIATLAGIGYRVEKVTFHEKAHLIYSAKVDEYWRKNRKIKKELNEIKKKQEESQEKDRYTKQLIESKERERELQLRNNQLQAENDKFKKQQNKLEDELGKAEFQIELIKTLSQSRKNRHKDE